MALYLLSYKHKQTEQDKRAKHCSISRYPSIIFNLAHPVHLIPVALKVKACPKNLILNPMMHGNFAKIYLHSSYSAPFSLVFSLALLLYVLVLVFLNVCSATATVLCLCILLATSFFSSVYYEQPSNAFTGHK